MIRNTIVFRNKIDNFYSSISIKSNIFDKFDECSISLDQSIKLFNSMINNSEAMAFCNKNNHFKKTLETLYSNIIKQYIDKCSSTEDLYARADINCHLCQFIIHYNFILAHPAFKEDLNELFCMFLYRFLNIAIKDGCVISWLTFASLYKNMVNEECFPVINKTTELYKKVNWSFLKNHKLYKTELSKFLKYNKLN